MSSSSTVVCRQWYRTTHRRTLLQSQRWMCSQSTRIRSATRMALSSPKPSLVINALFVAKCLPLWKWFWLTINQTTGVLSFLYLKVCINWTTLWLTLILTIYLEGVSKTYTPKVRIPRLPRTSSVPKKSEPYGPYGPIKPKPNVLSESTATNETPRLPNDTINNFKPMNNFYNKIQDNRKFKCLYPGMCLTLNII